MQSYLDLLNELVNHGVPTSDRTGVGTRSLFGRTLRFDLSKGFPLVTTKKVHFKSVAVELLWFLKGVEDTSYLHDMGVTIWNEWEAKVKGQDGLERGSIGPMYGVQWRHFPDGKGGTIDQLQNVLNEIKRNPSSRRLVVSAWNPQVLPDPMFSPKENVLMGNGALAPCHAFFQFYVQKGKLSLMITQRSADIFLGVPFNIASYALLTHLCAQQTGLEPGDLIWSGGDVHLYENHVEQAKLQLSRKPYPLPTLVVERAKSIDEYTLSHLSLIQYECHPAIKAPVAV